MRVRMLLQIHHSSVYQNCFNIVFCFFFNHNISLWLLLFHHKPGEVKTEWFSRFLETFPLELRLISQLIRNIFHWNLEDICWWYFQVSSLSVSAVFVIADERQIFLYPSGDYIRDGSNCYLVAETGPYERWQLSGRASAWHEEGPESNPQHL